MLKKFESELDAYPGYFMLPDPFLERHMRTWWTFAVEKLKGVGQLEFEFFDSEWHAAIALIMNYGEWDVVGVPIGDIQTDSVPMDVKKWVMEATSNYVYPFLPGPMLRKAFGTTARLA
jgi:hypothetical protein